MISISLDLGEDLPSLFADSTQIEQVLLNLVSNSRDAMPQGGGVTISTREVLLGEEFTGKYFDFLPGRYVLLMVSDTGQGMDHETLLHMFEPFFTTKEKDKGTGLGMAMVYGIIQGHGGHIHCESRVGGGTTFRIYLPVEKRPDAQKVVDVPSPSGLKGGETILIVDDQEIVLQILEDMLLQYGYSVIQCRSGEEALETYSKRAKEIDLVIMDLGMPGMGGEAAISAFKAMHRPPKILVASGYSSHRISVSPRKFGAADFISKPYRFKELLAKVRTILDREKKMKGGGA
jgi:two-component system, cell cycle sensor histidine kinase and response regulator CckA